MMESLWIDVGLRESGEREDGIWSGSRGRVEEGNQFLTEMLKSMLKLWKSGGKDGI